MKISEAKELIAFGYEERRPMFLWGPPGIGKTDVVGQFTGEAGLDLIDFRLALRDPTDLKGFPVPDMKADVMKFLRDDELPKKGEGILFFDEMNSALPAVQAACMQLTLTGRIGSYQLPKGWSCMAAGNRMSDRGVTHRMPTPLANRLTHLDVECNHDEWIEWAYANGISAELIAFHRFRTDKLFTFDAKSPNHAFGTPRTWVATERALQSTKLSEAGKLHYIKGTVGDGEGSEYWAFLKTIKDLPRIEDIKKNPEKVPVPERPDILHAVVTMLVSHTDIKSFTTFAKFSARLPLEFEVVYMKDLHRKLEKDGFDEHPVYMKWALKNHHLMV